MSRYTFFITVKGTLFRVRSVLANSLDEAKIKAIHDYYHHIDAFIHMPWTYANDEINFIPQTSGELKYYDIWIRPKGIPGARFNRKVLK
jgi:hypothetical protein